jgi:hypothetical protein
MTPFQSIIAPKNLDYTADTLKLDGATFYCCISICINSFFWQNLYSYEFGSLRSYFFLLEWFKRRYQRIKRSNTLDSDSILRFNCFWILIAQIIAEIYISAKTRIIAFKQFQDLCNVFIIFYIFVLLDHFANFHWLIL